jgi:ankyrin repeat protein
MATMLIDAGADVNATNAEELTALHWAAVRGRTEVRLFSWY